jgi:outer membrane protein TolC
MKHKNISKKIIIIAIGICSPPILSAQNSTVNLSLSLKQAEQYAIDNNRTLRNTSLEVQKAKAAQWQTIATMLPQVSAGFDYQNVFGYEIEMAGFKIPMNPNGALNITASVSLSGAQIVGSMLNNLAIDMASIQKGQKQQEIRSKVANIYASILVTEETQQLLDSNYLNLQQLYDMVDNAVKAGATEQVEADQIAIQVSSTLNRINASKRAIETLYNALRLLLGIDINTSIILTDDIYKVLNPDETQRLLSSSFNIHNNFSYQLLLKNKELTRQQTILAGMDYLPSVTAVYQYSYRTYFGKDAGMNMSSPNLFNLQIRIPLWSSGQRAAKVHEARIAEKIIENTVFETENMLRSSDKQLRYDLASSLDEYENQRNNIDVSKRVFDNIANKYEYGAASSLDLTNASNNFIIAQSAYIQSMLNLLNARIALEDLLNNTNK